MHGETVSPLQPQSLINFNAIYGRIRYETFIAAATGIRHYDLKTANKFVTFPPSI